MLAEGHGDGDAAGLDTGILHSYRTSLITIINLNMWAGQCFVTKLSYFTHLNLSLLKLTGKLWINLKSRYLLLPFQIVPCSLEISGALECRYPLAVGLPGHTEDKTSISLWIFSALWSDSQHSRVVFWFPGAFRPSQSWGAGTGYCPVTKMAAHYQSGPLLKHPG